MLVESYAEQQVVLISPQQQVEWQGLATNIVHLFTGVMGMDTTRRRLKSAATSSPRIEVQGLPSPGNLVNKPQFEATSDRVGMPQDGTKFLRL
jgi:hypothetical protein